MTADQWFRRILVARAVHRATWKQRLPALQMTLLLEVAKEDGRPIISHVKEITGYSRSTISRQLATLAQAGLVKIGSVNTTHPCGGAAHQNATLLPAGREALKTLAEDMADAATTD